jgi:hypothetical protein
VLEIQARTGKSVTRTGGAHLSSIASFRNDGFQINELKLQIAIAVRQDRRSRIAVAADGVEKRYDRDEARRITTIYGVQLDVAEQHLLLRHERER